MYNKTILDRLSNLKNAGMLKKPEGIGTFKTATDIEELKVFLRVENGVVKDAKFKTFGGVATIVCADVAMDLIKNKTIDEVLNVSSQEVNESVGGLPEDKIQSAEIVIRAIGDAIKYYRKRLIKLALLDKK